MGWLCLGRDACPDNVTVVCGAAFPGELDIELEALAAHAPQHGDVLGHGEGVDAIYFHFLLLGRRLLQRNLFGGAFPGNKRVMGCHDLVKHNVSGVPEASAGLQHVCRSS